MTYFEIKDRILSLVREGGKTPASDLVDQIAGDACTEHDVRVVLYDLVKARVVNLTADRQIALPFSS